MPLQLVVPPEHTSWQLPATHCCPAAHVVPHAPQFEASLCRLTHVPLQSVRPEVQVVLQVPAEHVWPGPHDTPHAPQLPLSLCTSSQTLGMGL